MKIFNARHNDRPLSGERYSGCANGTSARNVFNLLAPFALLSFSLILFSSCESAKEEKTVLSESNVNETGYIMNDNSAVRFEPHLFSARVDNLNKGDKVTVIGRSAEKSKIAKVEDYWLRVITPSGITAWTFGSNVKLMKEGDDATQKELDRLANERKADQLAKTFKGVWWSTTASGTFTSHKLTIYEDRKYKSERGGQKIEGEWSIDFDKNAVLFSNGTTAGKEFALIERGQDIFFEAASGNDKMRIIKTKDMTDLDEEKQKKEDEELLLQLQNQ